MARMMAFVRDLLRGRLPPAQLAGLAVEAQHDELVVFVRGIGPLLQARIIARQVARVWSPAGGNGREDEDLIAPDDGRGAAAAGERSFPLDVLLFVPGDRWVGFWRRAVRVRTAPMVPIVEPSLLKVVCARIRRERPGAEHKQS